MTQVQFSRTQLPKLRNRLLQALTSVKVQVNELDTRYNAGEIAFTDYSPSRGQLVKNEARLNQLLKVTSLDGAVLLDMADAELLVWYSKKPTTPK